MTPREEGEERERERELAIAALLAREGLDYLQTKAVFKAARQKAGLKAPKARKSSPARLSLEEELRFIDQAYARGGCVPSPLM